MFFSHRTELSRGIGDGRWSTKDKLDQYRGVLKLYGRERKLGSQDAGKLKKKVSWQLGSFQEDVKKYRRIVSDTANGILNGRTHSLLQGRKDLQLKCHGRETEHIYASVYEESNRKRLRLDKLRFEKERKMKRCFDLQLEHAELFDDYLQEQRVPWTRSRTQQQLITRFQRSIAKQNAAKAINLTYASMLGILKQDTVRHETLLAALKQDRQSQCEVILEATIMGQLAVEESDDIGEKRRRVTRKVWNNMKERERALTIVRGQAEDLWSFARSLIRTESEAMFARERTRATTASNATLEGQMKSLERVFGNVKESLLVRSYRELLSRLEEQMKQRTRLLERFDRNVKERDSLLSKKTDALSTLSDIEHSLVAGVEEYNGDKNILLEQIAIQKEREFERKSARKDRGKLLMDIRAALQNTVAMLVCVRRGSKVAKRQTKETDRTRSRSTREEKDTDTDEHEEQQIMKFDIPIMEKMETEGLTLLSTVSRKVGALFGMSNFEFDKDREDRAKDLYQTYVSDYHSKLRFDDVDLEPTGLFVEHEAIDSSVPTRAEIKLRSKRAVETYLRLE